MSQEEKLRLRVSSRKGFVTREITNVAKVLGNTSKVPDDQLTEIHLAAVVKVKDRLEKQFASYEEVLEQFNSEFTPDPKQDDSFNASFMEVQAALTEIDRLLVHINAIISHVKKEMAMTPALATSRLKQADKMRPSEEIALDMTLARFRDWAIDYTHYYEMANHAGFPLAEQQGFLLKCLKTDIRGQVRARVKHDTPVLKDSGTERSLLNIIHDILAKQVPLITRRIALLDVKQKTGEKFSQFQVRMTDATYEAELYNFTQDELVALLYVRGFSDGKLREHILRENLLTKEDIERTAEMWEVAANTKTSATTSGMASATSTASVKKMSNYQKGKKSGQAQQQKSSSVQQTSEKGDKCKACNRQHSRDAKCWAADKKCHACDKSGHIKGSALCKTNNSTKGNNKETVKSLRVHKMRNVKLRRTSENVAMPMMEIEAISASGGSKKLTCVADTGCTASVISLDYFDGLEDGLKESDIDTSKTAIIEAAGGTTLKCYGTARLTVKFGDGREAVEIEFLVSQDLDKECYLSFNDLKTMGLIHKEFPNQAAVRSVKLRALKSDVESLIKKYEIVFDTSTLKPMAGEPMTIYLKKDHTSTKPTHVSTARYVPIKREQAVKEALKQLQDLDIIEVVNWPTTWCAPTVIVTKHDGSIRLTTDFSGLNEVVERPTHPFPTPEELQAGIPAGTKWFVVADLYKGYHQVMIDEKSRDLTTFLTPWGRFRYKSAPMGLASSGDEFCRRTDEAMTGLEGVKKLVDDILVYGNTEAQVKKRFEAVLERCHQYGITLSPKKIQFGNRVKFAGMVITDEGVEVDPDKVDAIAKFPSPQTLTDLRSFKGLVEQLGGAHPDLAHAMAPLRDLLKPKNVFQWLPEHEDAFQHVKVILTDPKAGIRCHFDINLPTYVYTDASKLKGLGFAIVQIDPAEPERKKLVMAKSRFLKDEETRYATCEVEAKAIQFACERGRLYLAHNDFTVITDHRPLVSIFNRRNATQCDNTRLQNILEHVAGYNFNVEWTSGKSQLLADSLSRYPLFDEPSEEDFAEDELERVEVARVVRFNALSKHIDVSLKKIAEAAAQDAQYQDLMFAVRSAKNPRNLPPGHIAKMYASCWSEMSASEDGLIFLGNRIVVPCSMRPGILERLHAPHQGVTKTKLLAKQLYYWPGMVNDIKTRTESCQKCVEHLPSKPNEPLIQTTASRPMEAVSLDLFETGGCQYLVMTDRYSGWPWVARLKKTDSATVINAITNWLVDYGVPNAARTDGGPQFRREFAEFCASLDIDIATSSPYHARSNGHAESAVKQMKYLLEKVDHNWDDFRMALLEWRNTPRVDTGLSPAQSFLGRRQRTTAPAAPAAYDRITLGEVECSEGAKEKALKKTATDEAGKEDSTSFKVGDQVVIQNRMTGKWNICAAVARVLPGRGGRSLLLKDMYGYTRIRNRKLVRPRRFGQNVTVQQASDVTNSSEDSSEPKKSRGRPKGSKNKPKNKPAIPRRSVRIKDRK